MKSNPHEFEPYGKDCGKNFGSPVAICRVSTNAMTLPSSSGSCGSISSDADSIETPPPPVNYDGEESNRSSVKPSGCMVSKIILMLTAFLLLYGAGLLGGFLTSRKSLRNANVPASNNEGMVNGSQTFDESLETTSPSAIFAVTFANPTAAPVTFPEEQLSPTADPATSSPTGHPTEITADVTRVPIPPPPTSQFSSDGTYNYRANNEYLVGV
jgi:hypothetical protein